METADRLIVTHVRTVIEEADTFFPQIDPLVWKVAERSERMHDEESGFDFEFVTYERMK
jgi:dihydrofolate reductase